MKHFSFFPCLLSLTAFMQAVLFELDDEMVADDDDREQLQDIINNAGLSEGYLTLARDIEVMEPKSPEDIYKVGNWMRLLKILTYIYSRDPFLPYQATYWLT